MTSTWSARPLHIAMIAPPWFTVPPHGYGGVEKRREGSPGAEATVSLVDWLEADCRELRARYERLYVPQNDGRWLKRNALVAVGNTGGPAERAAVERHAAGDDELLAEHARWALARMTEREHA